MYTKSIIFFFIIGVIATGCQDEFANSEVVDFGSFQMELPSTWRAFSAVGYDSQVGGITDGRDTLHYDYGWYSYNFNNETTETHSRTNTVIHGRDALIVRPNRKGKGVIGLYVEPDGLNKLSIYGLSKKEQTVLRIFESVRFD